MAREICYYAVVYLPRWSFWCPIALEPSAAFQCHNCAMSSVCQSHCGYSQLWYLPGLAFTHSVLQELCAVQWPAHKFTHKQLGITWRKIRCAWRLHHKFERQNHRLISYFPLWILYFFHLKVLQATTVYKLHSCSCVLRCAIQKTWLQERSFVAVWGSEYTRWPKDPKDYCARLCGFSQFTRGSLQLEAVLHCVLYYSWCSGAGWDTGGNDGKIRAFASQGAGTVEEGPSKPQTTGTYVHSWFGDQRSVFLRFAVKKRKKEMWSPSTKRILSSAVIQHPQSQLLLFVGFFLLPSCNHSQNFDNNDKVLVWLVFMVDKNCTRKTARRKNSLTMNMPVVCGADSNCIRKTPTKMAFVYSSAVAYAVMVEFGLFRLLVGFIPILLWGRRTWCDVEFTWFYIICVGCILACSVEVEGSAVS